MGVRGNSNLAGFLEGSATLILGFGAKINDFYRAAEVFFKK